MKKTKISSTIVWLGLIASIVIMASNTKAQSISISNTSIPAWGAAPETARFSLSFDNISAVLFSEQAGGRWLDPEQNRYEGKFIGVFVHPYTIDNDWAYIIPVAGILHRKYPTQMGSLVHFSVEIGIRPVPMLSFSYSHMSNGFGIANSYNPGIDNLNARIHF